jgi:NitT/TauT family transport system substrate-binding protein
MPRSRFLRQSVAAAAVLLATALSFPAPARAADDKLIVIGGSVATGFFEVLEHVAQRAGFYKEEHLDVENQYVVGAPIAAQLVASGKGDICSLAIEPLIQGFDKGLRLQAFFSRDPVYDYALAVLSDSPIRTLADFKGATIGEIAPNSPAAGLKKGDVTYVPIGNGAQAIAALTSGKVAAAAFPYPELLIYESIAPITFRYFHHPILKDIGNVAYAATPDTIAAKADALRRFARAHVKAAIFVRENPQVAARYFLQGAGMSVTPESLRNETRLLELSQGQLPGVNPTSPRIGEMPPLGIEVYIKFMNANGLLNAPVPASAVVTNQFIGYANNFDRAAFIARVRAMR